MAVTKYSLADQCKRILYSGNSAPKRNITPQELIIAVNQQFAYAIKQSLWANKAEGINEVNGTFIYSFKNIPILRDSDLEQYYSQLPATYIDLPNEAAVQYVGIMKSGSDIQSQAEPMVRVFNGFSQLSRGLALENLQTRKAFYVEGSNVVYIGMTDEMAKNKILMKLAVSLDGIDEDTPVNIPPEIQQQIVDMVVKQYLVEKQIPVDKTANKMST